MRWQFITKYTNICYKHHNIHITVSKPAIIIATVDKKNDNNNEEDIIKIAGILKVLKSGTRENLPVLMKARSVALY